MFRQGTREWHNPVLALMTNLYRIAVRWAIHRRWTTVGVAAICVIAAAYLATSGLIGSDSAASRRRRHLGARHISAEHRTERGHTAGEPGPGLARVLPRGHCGHKSSGTARDDGTDTTGFFNTEYFVDLKPKDQWRPVFSPGKEHAHRRHESRARQDPEE